MAKEIPTIEVPLTEADLKAFAHWIERGWYVVRTVTGHDTRITVRRPQSKRRNSPTLQIPNKA